MFLKRLQLGLIHAAVAITLVPINSTLNRIMIEDKGILATLVVLLFSPPYLFSFIQVVIGAYSDRHPFLGLRRTPYILAGLLLCVFGLMMSTRVATILPVKFWPGLGLGILTFGAWGMGYNLATVSYFSLASEISGEKERSKSTAVMFFVMIVSIIISAAALSRMLEDFTPAGLQNAFMVIAIVALGMGLLGLIGLEARQRDVPTLKHRYSLEDTIREVRSNSQVARFFLYLMLMLAAVLGQDVLLEPFAARAFHLPVDQTTRITAIWGTCYLVSLLVAGILEGRISKLSIARLSSISAVIAFVLVAASGLLASKSLFFTGLVLLGLATGPATVSNLSLMLDMTVPGKVGLFIGAWGSASSFARLLGSLSTAIVRDMARLLPNQAVLGYAAGFSLLALFLIISLFILNRVNLAAFQRSAEDSSDASIVSIVDRARLANGES